MAKTKQTEFQHISPNFGYAYDVQQVLEHVLLHEVNSKTKYSLIQEDQNFGSGVWSIEDFNILWEESDKIAGERIAFDGVPFFILHRKTLGCQFGMRKSSLKDDDLSGQPKKRSCPATITMKEVIRFPDYKMQNETPYEKKKWTKVLNQDAANGIARSERRIYVETPPVNAHVHSIVVKASSGIPETNITVPLCLICNAKLSTSTRSAIALFSGETRTSHRQLEVRKVVGSILSQELEEETAHSSIICSRCFNLIDDIDSLEEQLENKKQIVVDRYKRTVSLVTGNVQAEIPRPSEDDFVETYGKRGRGRGRGKSVGRGRGRGPGRPRGRPKGSGSKSVENHCTIKVENDSGKEDEEDGGSSSTFFTSLKSPPSLKTIKREDIMSDLDVTVERQPKFEDSFGNAGEVVEQSIHVAVDGEDLASMEDVTMNIRSYVMDAVEEVLEEEKKRSKMFSCSECEKQFHTKAAVKNHIKVHNNQQTFECEDCKKSFSTHNRLKNHLKTHLFRDKNKRYSCKVCSKVFYARCQLKTHMKSHGELKSFVCKLCGKVLSSQKTLEAHAMTHSGEKPFQCEICGSTFRQRSNLQTHIKATHYQEKKFHCQMCQKSFVRKRLLGYHMNSVHTGERPYKCDMCSATFVYPHYFKRHLRKHTGVKPYRCHICNKSFSSRENRNAHMFTHSDKKPYECQLCGAGFMRKPLCVAHVTHHGQPGRAEDYINFNSPNMLLRAGDQEVKLITPDEEVAQAVHAVTLSEGAPHEGLGESVQIMRDAKVVKVMSRPIHIIEADESTRYVIHTANDRGTNENMDHFFASLQSQVVEVRSEDF